MNNLIIKGILVILLISGIMSVSAEVIPDLKGSWTGNYVEQYSPNGGFENLIANLISYQITD